MKYAIESVSVCARVRRMAGQRGPLPRQPSWRRVLRRDPCSYCGTRPSGTIDHITPRADGAPQQHRISNSAGACSSCNQAKGSMSLLGYLAEMWIEWRDLIQEVARR